MQSSLVLRLTIFGGVLYCITGGDHLVSDSQVQYITANDIPVRPHISRLVLRFQAMPQTLVMEKAAHLLEKMQNIRSICIDARSTHYRRSEPRIIPPSLVYSLSRLENLTWLQIIDASFPKGAPALAGVRSFQLNGDFSPTLKTFAYLVDLRIDEQIGSISHEVPIECLMRLRRFHWYPHNILASLTMQSYKVSSLPLKFWTQDR